MNGLIMNVNGPYRGLVEINSQDPEDRYREAYVRTFKGDNSQVEFITNRMTISDSLPRPGSTKTFVLGRSILGWETMSNLISVETKMGKWEFETSSPELLIEFQNALGKITG